MDEVKAALADVEKDQNKKLGDSNNPLLLSVRSGAKFSMPGMMDTVLNLGLNNETAAPDDLHAYYTFYGDVTRHTIEDVAPDSKRLTFHFDEPFDTGGKRSTLLGPSRFALVAAMPSP